MNLLILRNMKDSFPNFSRDACIALFFWLPDKHHLTLLLFVLFQLEFMGEAPVGDRPLRPMAWSSPTEGRVDREAKYLNVDKRISVGLLGTPHSA